MQTQTIQLNLTIDQANLVLKALGRMPYEDVFQLVGEIQQQASRQLDAPEQQKP